MCSVVPPFAQFFLLFMGMKMLKMIKFNQFKAVLKHNEEASSCFNTYGCHATEKDFSFPYPTQKRRSMFITSGNIRRNCRKFQVGIEWNRIFSGNYFRKFRTTFSVFSKRGNFGIFENSRVSFKSFQSDCLKTYEKRRQEA